MRGSAGENEQFDAAFFALALVRDAPDAIVLADAAGRIRFWNAGARRVFGYTEAQALGQTLDIIIPESLRERHWAGFSKTIETGQTRYGAGDLLSVPALRSDGARISVEFTIHPFLGDDGRITGIAAILRDVTKRFEELKELRRLAARAPVEGG